MMREDKDLLVCDLAETYGITDLKALSVETLAALSFGLPSNSRIMRKMSGQKLTLEQTLLAAIFDRLSILCWLNSDDSRKGRNRPKSLLSELMQDKNENERPQSFGSPDELLARMNELRGC